MSKQTNLKLGDRMQLANILPAKDSFERLLIRDGIIEKTKIKPEDVAKHKLTTNAATGSITWENDDLSYKYEFTPEEEGYIRENLKTLSDKKELGADAIGLYKMFVNG